MEGKKYIRSTWNWMGSFRECCNKIATWTWCVTFFKLLVHLHVLSLSHRPTTRALSLAAARLGSGLLEGLQVTSFNFQVLGYYFWGFGLFFSSFIWVSGYFFLSFRLLFWSFGLFFSKFQVTILEFQVVFFQVSGYHFGVLGYFLWVSG